MNAAEAKFQYQPEKDAFIKKEIVQIWWSCKIMQLFVGEC